MPQAATHILIAIVIASLIRDYVVKDKKKFPLHYVLIAGIAGLLPDIDVAAYWILYYFGFSFPEVHRTFTHTIFIPIAFLLFALLTIKVKNKEFGKHHLKLSYIFLMIFLGIFVHLILDATLAGYIRPFYPVSDFTIGLNLVDKLPVPLKEVALPVLDAIMLVFWLVYMEWKHKISDFI